MEIKKEFVLQLQKLLTLYKFLIVPVATGTGVTRGSRGTERHTVDPLSIVDSFVSGDFLEVARAVGRLEDLDVAAVDIPDGRGLGAGETDTRADVVGGLERVHFFAAVIADLNCVFSIGDAGACGR